MPRNPIKAPCTFPGCHNWAMRGTDRCRVHQRAADPGPAHEDPLPTQDAPPERTDPGPEAAIDDDPLGLLPPPEELDLPDNIVLPSNADFAALDDLYTHVAALNESLHALTAYVRRLQGQIEHDPALVPTYIRLLTLQGQLTSRLARLARERQQIRQSAGHDEYEAIMNVALDQASEILGVQL
jgi:hypothetical protein